MGGPRKIVTRVIFFLLLGAIVNVAVAWGCALVITHYQNAQVDQEMRDWFSDALVRHDLQLTHSWSTWGGSNSRGARFIWVSGALHGQHTDATSLHAIKAGWPADGVWGEYWLSANLKDGSTYESSRGAIVLAGLGPNQLPRILPRAVVWPGFAINTVFYAATLWMLFAAPFALRRRRRIRRGLCPACAYPVGMGASPVCTECGKPLIKQNAETQKAEMS